MYKKIGNLFHHVFTLSAIHEKFIDRKWRETCHMCRKALMNMENDPPIRVDQSELELIILQPSSSS